MRVVLDTNVILSAELASSPHGPNREILRRWRAGEFIWLYSADILKEYAEKLLEFGVDASHVAHLLTELAAWGCRVWIGHYHVRRYPSDADDTPFLLLALNGGASHLVTYDQHLLDVGIFYPEIETCGPLEFLKELRARTWPAP